MPAKVLPILTRAAYLDARGRRRFDRWNAVVHDRVTSEEHELWRAEQDEEIARAAAYRQRVGESSRMGRVIGMDGTVMCSELRPKPAQEGAPTIQLQPEAYQPLLYYGEELPDITGPPIAELQ